MSEPANILVIGCGFVGKVLAETLHTQGDRVCAMTKDPENAQLLGTNSPYPVLAADISDPESLRAATSQLPELNVIIHCASSNRGGPEAYQAVFVNGCRNLLNRFPDARLVFSSSTSVYGQNDGSWVTEESPALPSAPTGKILREAEDLVLANGGIVARLAGLYGPGRWVQLRRLREGTAVLEDGGIRWQNQVHRDDAAAALALLAKLGNSGSIYNVTDDLPLTQAELYRILAGPTGVLPPEGPSSPNRKRGVTSKRVSNQRLHALGWQPRYPTVAIACEQDPALAL